MYGYTLPEDFLIGTANSAFQSEGAWDKDGKSESIMDHYAKLYAGKVAPSKVGIRGTVPFSTEMPDRGCFFYEKYEEYIEDMQKTGQNTYRMSLAWPRIIPDGTGKVNQKAIDHYNKVIDKMIECGLTPFVDIYHWDMPQCLMDQGGFENPAFPEWYENYAKVCFEAFGDRVKLWSTFNETQVSISTGHELGNFPPFKMNLKDSLLAGHHVILAHYRAVRLYKSMNLGGKIGAVNCIAALSPAHMNETDMGAVVRQVEKYFGWWTEAMTKGTYPQVIIRECPKMREALPPHYQEDLDKYFIPMDFIGVNYYVAGRTEYVPDTTALSKRVESFYSAPGQRFAPYPAGLFDVVQYICERFPGLDVYITENGCAIPNQHDEEKETDDPERISYIREHLRMVSRLIRAGYPVKGYYYWNDADSYEELDGNNLRFGLTWVDHETGKKVWKKSRYYFSEICKSRIID